MSETGTASAATVQPEKAQPAHGFARRIYEQWRRGAHAVGVVQTRFLMFLIYLIAVVPTGLLMRLSSDPLQLRKPEKSNCRPARHEERDLETARRQF
jgi:hypothetical protein